MLPAFARAGRQLLLPRGLLGALISTSSEALEPVASAAAAKAPAAKPTLLKEFQVYRWSPDSSEKPKYVSYKVDINK